MAAEPPRERERRARAARLIYISRELSARLSIFQGAPRRAIRGRVPGAGGSHSPRWALNIHQFPADICVTRALQPARRVSAIGNTRERALFFVLSREFLPRPPSLPCPHPPVLLLLFLCADKNAPWIIPCSSPLGTATPSYYDYRNTKDPLHARAINSRWKLCFCVIFIIVIRAKE